MNLGDADINFYRLKICSFLYSTRLCALKFNPTPTKTTSSVAGLTAKKFCRSNLNNERLHKPTIIKPPECSKHKTRLGSKKREEIG
jgi:hypothetical protein